MLESRSSMGVVTIALLLVCFAVNGISDPEHQYSTTGRRGSANLSEQLDKFHEPVFRLRSSNVWLSGSKVAHPATSDQASPRSATSFSAAFQKHPFVAMGEADFCHWNNQPIGTPHQTLIALRGRSLAPQKIDEPVFHNGVRVFQFGGVYFLR